MSAIRIVSTGRALPGKVMTNDDMSKIVDTSDEWISSRTGIKQRYFCDGEMNWQLAVESARKAIEKGDIDINEIGMVIVATFSPDYAFPSVACLVQKELGLRNDIMAFDLNAACTGFLYALNVAEGILNSSGEKYALVIGSEQISTRLNMEDRNTCVLFGDGAGAAVIEKNVTANYATVMGSDGNTTALICPGQAMENQYIDMDGKKVFKFAVSTVGNVINELLEKTDKTIQDIDYVICHQANERIIKTIIKQFDCETDKFYMNMSQYGNTSAASIPIAIDEMYEKGLLAKGKTIIMVGFGAGFTWGGMLLEC
ncbi:MAG: ketoacyl-ACP synthase III [Lachnospiraceae bacterium]|nr:ketoacyl-ACP synthase III [Lachnospiraceae bacterium]